MCRLYLLAIVRYVAALDWSVVLESRPVQTSPDQTRPVQTRRDQTSPDQTRPDQTSPDKTRPVHTRPNQTRPVQTRPDQVRSGQARPVKFRCFIAPLSPPTKLMFDEGNISVRLSLWFASQFIRVDSVKLYFRTLHFPGLQRPGSERIFVLVNSV